MAHTNETPNFNLPQFIASDMPAWLTDVNQAFTAIDGSMQENKDAAAASTQAASAASAKADTAYQLANTANGTAQTAASAVTTGLQGITNGWKNAVVTCTSENATFYSNGTKTFNTISISYNDKLKLLQVGGQLVVNSSNKGFTINFTLPSFVPAPSSDSILFSSVIFNNNGVAPGTPEIGSIFIGTDRSCRTVNTEALSSPAKNCFFAWCGLFPFITVTEGA